MYIRKPLKEITHGGCRCSDAGSRLCDRFLRLLWAAQINGRPYRRHRGQCCAGVSEGRGGDEGDEPERRNRFGRDIRHCYHPRNEKRGKSRCEVDATDRTAGGGIRQKCVRGSSDAGRTASTEESQVGKE